MARALPLVLGIATLLACNGAPPRATEMDMTTCHDHRDNDGNGLVDCHDPSCAAFCRPVDAGVADTNVDGGPLHLDGGACRVPLDVVFVVDVSTSMTREMAALHAGAADIWQTAHELSIDATISLVVFVDDVLAVDGTPPFPATGGCMPFGSAEDFAAQLAAWEMTCASGQDPVSHLPNHDCPENSLDAIVAAATTCPTRSGATRVILHVTDDTFEERPAVLSGQWGGGVPVQFTYLETSVALTDGQWIFGVFAETGVGDDCGAGRSPDVGRGFSGAFGMQPSLPDATGGRFWDLRQVRAGTIDMSASINDFLRAVYCTAP
jgi:hypothetical protein